MQTDEALLATPSLEAILGLERKDYLYSSLPETVTPGAAKEALERLAEISGRFRLLWEYIKEHISNNQVLLYDQPASEIYKSLDVHSNDEIGFLHSRILHSIERSTQCNQTYYGYGTYGLAKPILVLVCDDLDHYTNVDIHLRSKLKQWNIGSSFPPYSHVLSVSYQLMDSYLRTNQWEEMKKAIGLEYEIDGWVREKLDHLGDEERKAVLDTMVKYYPLKFIVMDVGNKNPLSDTAKIANGLDNMFFWNNVYVIADKPDRDNTDFETSRAKGLFFPATDENMLQVIDMLLTYPYHPQRIIQRNALYQYHMDVRLY